MSEQLEVFCTSCGRKASLVSNINDNDTLYILGPQNLWVKTGVAKIGHICRPCRHKIAASGLKLESK